MDKSKGKGKRGRQRKSPTLEVDLLELEAGLLVLKKKVAYISK